MDYLEEARNHVYSISSVETHKSANRKSLQAISCALIALCERLDAVAADPKGAFKDVNKAVAIWRAR